MFRRTVQLAIVASLLFASVDSASAAPQSAALKRVAKSVGRVLKQNNRSSVRLVRGPELQNEVGKKIETAVVSALTADAQIDEIDEEARFAVQVKYIRDGASVCMELRLLDNNNQSLGTFSVNFDLED